MSSQITVESKCFGVAYSASAKECGQCDVAQQCAKSSKVAAKPVSPNPAVKQEAREVELDTTPVSPAGETTMKAEGTTTFKPTTEKPPMKVSKTAAKEKKVKEVKPVNPDMPLFKDMTLEQLMELATNRGISDLYEGSEEKIRRMRIVMALKKTY